MLIVLAGLPASGKSVVARALKTELKAVLLDKDIIRACLFAEHVEYRRKQDDVCVSAMYDVACYHLGERSGVPVILDGRTYSRRYQIDAVKNAASRVSSSLCFIECVCSPETAQRRLEADKGLHIAQDRNYQLFLKSQAAAEPIEEPKLVLHTDENSVEACVRQAVSYIRERLPC